ncbi:hypothetical protein BGX28_006216 [Mortierella sp. GBA30]|nr:hypothetical protein BGX28_006216 [Mortierella sp. GBA30]
MTVELPESAHAIRTAISPVNDHHQQDANHTIALKANIAANLVNDHRSISTTGVIMGAPAVSPPHSPLRLANTQPGKPVNRSAKPKVSSEYTVDDSAHHHRQQEQHPPQQLQQQLSLALPPHALSTTHSNNMDSQTSPLQERCETLEAELSILRNRLEHSEQSFSSPSIITEREKRFSNFQPQALSSTEQSLQTLKQQHELTLLQLSKVQAEATTTRQKLERQQREIDKLKGEAQERGWELKEVLLDRDSLALEMVECHADNAKFLKRLRASNDKVERLQDENRHLIEQLRESRARVAEVTQERSKVIENLEKEKARASQVALELERIVGRYKEEVERLQDLVLAMGHKHVQIQAQLSFLQQQQARSRQQPLAIEPQLGSSSMSLSFDNSSSTTTTLATTKESASNISDVSTEYHGSILIDTSLESILSSVATTSRVHRCKPTRRFTVNASFHRELPLTPEQRKCDLLMDQITVLQRGYDSLRQEKITLELQLDLLQRQHQFQQQQEHQRQKRRDMQRRDILEQDEHENQLPPSKLIAAAERLSPVLRTERCSRTAQTEEQSSLLSVVRNGNNAGTVRNPRDQNQGTEEDRRRSQIHDSDIYQPTIAKAQMQETKDEQIREALASLESKRGRSNSDNTPVSKLEELKHLDRLRLGQHMKYQGSKTSSTNTPSKTPDMSPLSSAKYNPYSCHPPYQGHHHRHHRRAHEQVEWDIQQCSCCMGGLIEI